MYTLTITQNYIQNLLVFLAKIRLISLNLRQRLGKIDNTAVHRRCCSMTNTYNTYLGHINCYRYKLYQYLHIFRQPQFSMGVGLNNQFLHTRLHLGGLIIIIFQLHIHCRIKKNIIISPPRATW